MEKTMELLDFYFSHKNALESNLEGMFQKIISSLAPTPDQMDFFRGQKWIQRYRIIQAPKFH